MSETTKFSKSFFVIITILTVIATILIGLRFLTN